MINDSEFNETEPADQGDAPEPGRKRGLISDGLERAEREKFTEPPPSGTREQVQYLLSRIKGGTRALAARLGVSQRTVQRYQAGTVATPRAATREAMAEDTATQWQPDVRAQIRARAASTTGLVIETRCVFGFFTAEAGSTDDPRMRIVRERVSPAAAADILAAQENGANESDLHDLVAAALGWAYFQAGGTRAENLQVTMRDVQYIDFAFD